MNLVDRSIEIIYDGQSDTGAYLASPNFESYHYSWFRDGAFIAFAMDKVGESKSAARFHAWVVETLAKKQDVIIAAVEKISSGKELSHNDILHTRYTVEGQAGGEDWPNHQLDGFGTWLWALAEHQQISGSILPENWRTMINHLADYLIALWKQPCYDCWEEFADQIHPYTLSAVYGGLNAAQRLTGVDYSGVMQNIQQFVDQKAAPDGYFVKYLGTPLVDASLLGLSLPYGMVSLDDPRMLATVAKIETDLYHAGGVQRYAKDTYFGGGEWILLAAWLGWYDALTGRRQEAQEIRAWIESVADANGELPEQVPQMLNDPASYQPWVDRWGRIAQPLLWSHAMYLLLVDSLGD